MKPSIGLVILALLLTACGPRLHPTLAQRELECSAALDTDGSAKVGESLLAGLDMFVYPAYAPREALAPPSPNNLDLAPLDPERKWLVGYELDDGSLIIEAPASLAPENTRLGLNIDERGKVTGRRPWFDLKGKRRFALQPAWDGFRRLLFMPAESSPVDIFSFDLRYTGQDGKLGVFELLDFKHPRTTGQKRERIRIPEGREIRIHGLTIEIKSVGPEAVLYNVKRK